MGVHASEIGDVHSFYQKFTFYNMTIIEKLKQDPHYEEFFNNDEGRNLLCVEIDNIPCIFYKVGESIEGFSRILIDKFSYPDFAKKLSCKIVQVEDFLKDELSKRSN